MGMSSRDCIIATEKIICNLAYFIWKSSSWMIHDLVLIVLRDLKCKFFCSKLVE